VDVCIQVAYLCIPPCAVSSERENLRAGPAPACATCVLPGLKVGQSERVNGGWGVAGQCASGRLSERARERHERERKQLHNKEGPSHKSGKKPEHILGVVASQLVGPVF
jgi:hypothetical protein